MLGALEDGEESMRAIILSAGQGRRLLPLTADTPKCLLPVDGGRPVLEFQLEALARCGVRSVTVMVGFRAEKVEEFISRRPVRDLEVQTCYNPFVETTDNLVTCWLARCEMMEDFVLLNGDTIFQTEVLRRVLATGGAPVVIAIDRKAEYVDDDMKVTLGEGQTRLRAVGKTIPSPHIDGESIGLMAFRGTGVEAFRTTLDRAIRNPKALHKWYLEVIDTMAGSMLVRPVSIEGLWWTEIDSPADLIQARSDLERQAGRTVPVPSTSVGDEAVLRADTRGDSQGQAAKHVLPPYEHRRRRRRALSPIVPG
jgi:choline kinase